MHNDIYRLEYITPVRVGPEISYRDGAIRGISTKGRSYGRYDFCIAGL